MLCKVLITRRDPFSENLCVSDSTLDRNNVYKQKMKVKYSSTVSIYTFQLWSLHVRCDSNLIFLFQNYGTLHFFPFLRRQTSRLRVYVVPVSPNLSSELVINHEGKWPRSHFCFLAVFVCVTHLVLS